MGSVLALDNATPFSESLAEFFIPSFYPPESLGIGPTCSSGTTPAAALKHSHRALGCAIRKAQADIARRRVAEVLAENAG
jgi:DNA modification methylase